METRNQDDARALSILARAMMAGPVIFAILSLLIHFIKGPFIPTAPNGHTVFAVLLMVASLVLLFAGNHYNKQLQSIRENSLLPDDNREAFRKLFIVHYAICEMLALASIIAFLLLGDLLLFLPFLMALVEMFRKFPSADKISEWF